MIDIIQFVAGLFYAALQSSWSWASWAGLLIFGYTWPTREDGVGKTIFAAYVNLLQTEKMDRDGQIPATGVQQWDKGADVASAAALALGNDGNYFDITGTTGITSISQTAVGGGAVQAGTVVKLHFDGSCSITHSANLYLPGAANVTTVAGDELEFVCFGAGQWRCTKSTAGVSQTLEHLVTCLGDSMTDNATYISTLQTALGAGWKVNNCGVSGQKTSAMVLRFADQVTLIGDCEYVVILGGINDVASDVAAVTIEANLQAMYTAAANAGIKVVAVTMVPFKGSTSWSAGRQVILEAVNTWIKTTATDVDYVYDAYAAFEDPGNPDTMLAAYAEADWLHPNAVGSAVLGNGVYAAAVWTQVPQTPTLIVGGTARINQGVRNVDSPFFSAITTPFVRGSSVAGGVLQLQSTSHATKGIIRFGASCYDEVNDRFGTGTFAPLVPVDHYVDGAGQQTVLAINNTRAGAGDTADFDMCVSQSGAATGRLSSVRTGRVNAADSDFVLYVMGEYLGTAGGTGRWERLRISDNGAMLATLTWQTMDVDTVHNMGLGASYGLLIVRESATSHVTGVFRIEYQTIVVVSANALFTITKDNAATFNVYWETDQFKIQNKVGTPRVIRAAFYGT